ncbi:cystathionine beta-lyase [Burkholderia sp. Bp9143]|uniref:cystathionine beta-lyase n=1 Tax=Burkholderia sp. Bp9143 TaxID=2184574 RepID=UPI000F59C79C|nr:cystathionine beta-lyase [Burkholderia sp. Bp9143]RQR26245.1 cystathionine beta-lyase [Burkholderia sp. Bp9143]
MHWRTKLIQSEVQVRQDFKSLVFPVYRGSTVLFDRVSEVIDDWRQTENGYSYGLYGTPTTLELAARVCELEGAHRTFVVPGGQAAIAAIYLAFCSSGSHALVPVTAYGPNREMSLSILRRLGIEVEAYDPSIGSGISALIRDNTTLIWTESPGSVTMEVQDVPAIVAAAHARNVPVALDNTYAAGVMFDAFGHGVDVSMQALTKYIGGHSDLLLGTVSAKDAPLAELLGSTLKQLGMAVSPDDCSLALRGMQTLGVRLDRLESSTLTVARWLNENPAIETVLHPALPSCPGHEFWARDFTGSTSVFSVQFSSDYTAAQVEEFVESLKLFKIGMSWGGTTSLALVYPNIDRPGKDYAGRLVRFNIGLEEPSDLISDLKQAFSALAG